MEKHLTEEADGAGMQRLLQIGKLFHVSLFLQLLHFMYPFLKVKKFDFWQAPFGKTFFHICSP